MSNSIEDEMIANREARNVQFGPGQQMLDQVESEQRLVDEDESLKYIGGKG